MARVCWPLLLSSHDKCTRRRGSGTISIAIRTRSRIQGRVRSHIEPAHVLGTIFRISASAAALERVNGENVIDKLSRSWAANLECGPGGRKLEDSEWSSTSTSHCSSHARLAIDMQGCVTELTGFPKRVKLDGVRPQLLGLLNQL